MDYAICTSTLSDFGQVVFPIEGVSGYCFIIAMFIETYVFNVNSVPWSDAAFCGVRLGSLLFA